MLDFRVYWDNASKRISPLARHAAEIRYKQWLENLADGDIHFLKDAYNQASRNHPEYVVLDAKARIGVSSYMNPHEAGHAKFSLEFFEV